jgi:antitoxin PrlF
VACCECGCEGTGCSCSVANEMDGCQVEAVVKVDGRGQMVLPKDLRKRAGFGPDERLALISWRRGDQLCCVSLQRADSLAEAIRGKYGPLLSQAAP